jgi:hypothetical protein
MSEANLYGRIVTPNQVEQAMAACVGEWINDYLGELERIEGYDVGVLARPKGTITASEFAKWPEDQVPLILVLSSGLGGAPRRARGNGSYEAGWTVAVCAIVSDITEEATRRLAGAYAGAIRAAVMQHKMLTSSLYPDGFASFLTWRDEKYGDIPFADTRTLDSCRVVFNVGVENVVTEQAGPREPSAAPGEDPGPLPTVKEVDITVEPEAILA